MKKKMSRRNVTNWRSAISIWISCLVIPFAVFLTGCESGDAASVGVGATGGVMLAGMGVEAVRDWLLSGIQGIDKAQSTASMVPEAPAELAKSKKIVVEVGDKGMAAFQQMMPMGGGTTSNFNDVLAGYLMQSGYEVVSLDTQGSGNAMQDMMQASAKAATPSAQAAPQEPDRISTLRTKGVDLLIGGSVVSSMKTNMKMGIFMGNMETETTTAITSASLRVTKCTDGKMIMMTTVTYKKGKSPMKVAMDLAGIIDRARTSGAVQPTTK